MTVLFWALGLFLWGGPCCPLQAQDALLPYNGFRACVFDVAVLQVGKKSVKLKYRVANTGRVGLGTGSKRTVGKVVIELDSLQLPPLLWGHEKNLAQSAAAKLPNLAPGEISGPLWLDMPMPVVEEALLSLKSCPDLVIDNCQIIRYTKEALGLYVDVQNVGAAPAHVVGNSGGMAINFYFVGGAKLTRGAISAGREVLLLGRETLNGWLLPGQKLRLSTVLKTQKRTKFSANLLIELAPPPGLAECNKTNNIFSKEVKY